jgi:hemoglobin
LTDTPTSSCNDVIMESIFEHAGGLPALHRFIDAFYSSVLADPLLIPLFGAGRPEHVAHLTAFEAESFGGPDTFSRELGGFPHLIDVHRGLRITEEQRARFVALYLAAADTVGLPDDAPYREALRTHVEFGSHVAMQNSHAQTDEQLHPLREVPKWQWPAAAPDGPPS